MQLSPELIASLLQDVYAAAADPSLWEPFLRRLQSLTHASRSYLILGDPSAGSNFIAAQTDFDPYLMQVYAEQFAADDPVLKAAVAAQRRLGTDWVGDRNSILPNDQFVRTAPYNIIFRPQGDLHLIGAVLQMPGNVPGAIAMRRLSTDDPFEPEHIALLNILTPHLKQSLRLHTLLQAERRAGQIDAQALEAFGVAVLGADKQGVIRHVSSGAATLLAQGGGIQLCNGELQLPVLAEQDRLRQLITTAASTGRGDMEAAPRRLKRHAEAQWSREGDRTPGLGGAMQLTRIAPQTALVATVLPFAQTSSQFSNTLLGKPAAFIFLHDPAQQPLSRGDVLRSVYRITPTHVRLADALLSGLTVREASEAMGIAEDTARFHLKSIFRATGTKSQTEFLRLMLSLPGIAAN